MAARERLLIGVAWLTSPGGAPAPGSLLADPLPLTGAAELLSWRR
jgi:hypothetical protein